MGWTALGLAGAAGTGASPPRGGLGTSGRETGHPTRVGLSSLSVEQKLSGSHKALVEMQDVVAELLKTVSWEYPATKVRGWGPALEPTGSLLSPGEGGGCSHCSGRFLGALRGVWRSPPPILAFMPPRTWVGLVMLTHTHYSTRVMLLRSLLDNVLSFKIL